MRELTRNNNLSSIARTLNISKETVRRKVKELEGPFGRLRLRIDLYAIGLSQVILLSRGSIKKNKLLSSRYLRSIFHTYKIGERYNVINITPPLKALEKYIHFLKFISSKDTSIYVTYSPIYWVPDLAFIKNFNDPFIYEWNELTKDVEKASDELKINLRAQKVKRVGIVDYIDLYILRELERNPLRSIRSIAKDLGVSQQLAYYHYKNHVAPVILSRNLRIFLSKRNAVKGLLMIEFRKEHYLAKFLNVFISLPHCMSALLDMFKLKLLLSYQVYGYQYTDFVKAIFELKEVGLVKEIEDYGVFVVSIFHRKILPWKYALRPNGWVVDRFIKRIEGGRSPDNILNKVKVRLWK